MRNKLNDAIDEKLSSLLEGSTMITAIIKHQYVLIYLLLILLIYCGSLFLPNPELAGDIAFKQEDGGQAKVILDTLNNIAAFFTTLNTALFTACGALIVRGHEWAGREWGWIDKYAFVMILVAGATSYYGLYLSHVAILEMVAHGLIDPFGNQLQTGQQVQYYAFLTGSVLLGLVIVRLLDGRQLRGDRHGKH